MNSISRKLTLLTLAFLMGLGATQLAHGMKRHRNENDTKSFQKKAKKPSSFDAAANKALLEAADKGDLEGCKTALEAKTLLKVKANINAANENGYTSLHLACVKGHLDIVKYLIEQHAQIDAKNVFHNTPLHLACAHGHLAVVMYLIEKNAPLEEKTTNDKTPLQMAYKYNHFTVAQCLVAHGAVITPELLTTVNEISQEYKDLGSFYTNDGAFRRKLVQLNKNDIGMLKAAAKKYACIEPLALIKNCLETLQVADEMRTAGDMIDEKESTKKPGKYDVSFEFAL